MNNQTYQTVKVTTTLDAAVRGARIIANTSKRPVWIEDQHGNLIGTIVATRAYSNLGAA